MSKSGDYKSARPSKTQQHSQNATPSKQRKQVSQSSSGGQAASQNIVKIAKKKTKNYQGGGSQSLGTSRHEGSVTPDIINPNVSISSSLFGGTPSGAKQKIPGLTPVPAVAQS